MTFDSTPHDSFRVSVPAALRSAADGRRAIRLQGVRTVGEVLAELESRFQHGLTQVVEAVAQCPDHRSKWALAAFGNSMSLAARNLVLDRGQCCSNQAPPGNLASASTLNALVSCSFGPRGVCALAVSFHHEYVVADSDCLVSGRKIMSFFEANGLTFGAFSLECVSRRPKWRWM